MWRSLRTLGRLVRGADIGPSLIPPAPGGSGASTVAPLFIYSQVVWDEVWQRPQEFALGAARRRPVVFFSPVQVHRLYDSLGRWRRVQRVEREGARLTVLTPLILPGEYKSFVARRLNAAILRREIRRLFGSRSPRPRPTLVTNSPFSWPLVDALDWRAVVYDVIDDFPAFEWAPREAREWHNRLVRRADAVVTGTRALLDQAAVVRPEAEYIPCGVRFERFHREPRDAGATPPELARLDGPIVGYVGSLSGRIDRELLSAAARAYPRAQFVLIGPVHGSFGEPPRGPNLHYLGLKPHEALADYMNRFDLALMPFRLSKASLAINPVKTLEYLASGCVTLSTAIPDVVRFHSDVVEIARGHTEFVERVGELLAADNAERRARGVERARAASWDEMTRRIEAAIERAEKGRKGPEGPQGR